MIEEYFGFCDEPFGDEPDAQFVHAHASFAAAAEAVLDGVRRRAGLMLLTAAPGSGKTIFLSWLESELETGACTARVIGAAGLGDEALLARLCEALGIRIDGASAEARMSRMEAVARSFGAEEETFAILVDDADALSDTSLGRIAALVAIGPAPGSSAVQVVLAATPALAERLARPPLLEAGAAVRVRAAIAPLDQRGTNQYVRHRLRRVGYVRPVDIQVPELFPPATVAALHAHTGGNPLLVNRLCARALTMAMAQGRRTVGAEEVARAAAVNQTASPPAERSPDPVPTMGADPAPVADPEPAGEPPPEAVAQAAPEPSPGPSPEPPAAPAREAGREPAPDTVIFHRRPPLQVEPPPAPSPPPPLPPGQSEPHRPLHLRAVAPAARTGARPGLALVPPPPEASTEETIQTGRRRVRTEAFKPPEGASRRLSESEWQAAGQAFREVVRTRRGAEPAIAPRPSPPPEPQPEEPTISGRAEPLRADPTRAEPLRAERPSPPSGKLLLDYRSQDLALERRRRRSRLLAASLLLALAAAGTAAALRMDAVERLRALAGPLLDRIDPGAPVGEEPGAEVADPAAGLAAPADTVEPPPDAAEAEPSVAAVEEPAPVAGPPPVPPGSSPLGDASPIPLPPPRPAPTPPATAVAPPLTGGEATASAPPPEAEPAPEAVIAEPPAELPPVPVAEAPAEADGAQAEDVAVDEAPAAQPEPESAAPPAAGEPPATAEAPAEVAAVPAAPPIDPEERARRLHDLAVATSNARAAMNAHESGDYETAIELYSRAIWSGHLSQANLAIVFNNRGLAYAETGDDIRALEDYTTAIELDADYAQAFANRGDLRLRQGLIEEASADFSTAIDLNPALDRAWYGRARASDAAGQTERAVSDLETAIGLAPNVAEYQALLAEVQGR